MKTNTTHVPRVISTAKAPTATVNAYGEDVRVAALIAEYAPIAAAKAAKDKARAKLLADLKIKHGGKNAN